MMETRKTDDWQVVNGRKTKKSDVENANATHGKQEAGILKSQGEGKQNFGNNRRRGGRNRAREGDKAEIKKDGNTNFESNSKNDKTSQKNGGRTENGRRNSRSGVRRKTNSNKRAPVISESRAALAVDEVAPSTPPPLAPSPPRTTWAQLVKSGLPDPCASIVSPPAVDATPETKEAVDQKKEAVKRNRKNRKSKSPKQTAAVANLSEIEEITKPAGKLRDSNPLDIEDKGVVFGGGLKARLQSVAIDQFTFGFNSSPETGYLESDKIPLSTPAGGNVLPPPLLAPSLNVAHLAAPPQDTLTPMGQSGNFKNPEPFTSNVEQPPPPPPYMMHPEMHSFSEYPSQDIAAANGMSWPTWQQDPYYPYYPTDQYGYGNPMWQHQCGPFAYFQGPRPTRGNRGCRGGRGGRNLDRERRREPRRDMLTRDFHMPPTQKRHNGSEFVRNQPLDHSDVRRRPFVGPAGSEYEFFQGGTEMMPQWPQDFRPPNEMPGWYPPYYPPTFMWYPPAIHSRLPDGTIPSPPQIPHSSGMLDGTHTGGPSSNSEGPWFDSMNQLQSERCNESKCI